MEKIVIIDGNSLINRAFYATPLLTNRDGIYLNAVYGFTNMLCKIFTDIQPTKISVCFDVGKPTFRHLQNKDYKATRKGMPNELAEQLPLLKNLLSAMGIKYIEKEGFEADDLIGSIAKKFPNDKKIIVSGDKDLFQLIDEKTTVLHTKKGITEYAEMNVETLKIEMGIKPNQIIDLKSLMGDTSDNIKGVEGIGSKTAKTLLDTYDNIDNLYNHMDELKGKLKEKLINGKEDAYESKWLATIKTDVELKENIEDFNYQFPFSKAVYDLMKKYEFNTIIKRNSLFDLSLSTESIKDIHSVKTTIVKSQPDLSKLKDNIKCKTLLSVDLYENDLYIYDGENEYLIKSPESNDLFALMEYNIENILQDFKEILESKEIKKIVYDAKDLKHILYDYGICELNGIEFDVSLAEYLIRCGTKISDSLSDLLINNEIDEKNRVYGLFELSKKFKEELDILQMTSLYRDIELPLVDCLFDMEINGVKMDIEELLNMKNNFQNQINIYTKEIYLLAGKEFNINSPKQLGEILFNDLKLPNKKKGSTASEILTSLVDYHPIINKIISYRKFFKMQGFIDSFLDKTSKKDGKLHTIYQQKLTTTGRLSSIEPNLQNVPVKDDLGKQLRKAFISSFGETGVLISSDYSQIELKLLANFSKDKKLIEAYKNGIDIHTKTATEIFKINQEDVTPDMRKKAKAINFGIIYGISDYGLSESIHSSIIEAKEYIKSYFQAFPSIKNYLDSLVDEATEKGYAITLYNRRRKIPELTAKNYAMKSFGKRISMNMPLQGSASDIIKCAMNKVNLELKSRKLRSKLILQIHDELIVDSPQEEIDEVKEILKNCMENVIKLDIPLTCDISYGNNWLEAL